MKKILHILNSLLPSGAETMLNSAAEYWDKDFEIHILATNKNIGEYADTLENSGYIIHHIYNKSYFKQHKTVWKFIKNNNFSIVHVHRQGEALSYEIDAFLGGAKRVVRTVHSIFVFHGLVQIREYITRQIGKLIGVKYISIGNSVHQNEKHRFGINCTLINNWYNENKFFFTSNETKQQAKRNLNIEENLFCIISVGNCSSIKNHLSILKAMSNIKRLKEDFEVLYLHLGKGYQEDEEKSFVVEHNLVENVKFIGFEDPIKYLQAADLYVMPSTNEGLSISALEAMSTGISCLFTSVPGLQDFNRSEFDNVTYCKLDDTEIEKFLSKKIQQGRQHNSKKQSVEIKSIYGIEQGVMAYEKVYLNKECDIYEKNNK